MKIDQNWIRTRMAYLKAYCATQYTNSSSGTAALITRAHALVPQGFFSLANDVEQVELLGKLFQSNILQNLH